MAKRDKSSVLIASNLGRRALMFDKDDVVRMLRAAVEREGGQSTFARLHGVHPSYVNKILNGRARVTKSVAKALGLREVYVAE